MLNAELIVKNLNVFAHHGWYEHERLTGGNYEISVRISWVISESDDFEELKKTLNYEEICSRIELVMSRPFSLIEQSCKAIFEDLMKIKQIKNLKVKVKKCKVPIKNLEATEFTLSNYSIDCQSSFL
ncbi:MAG: Dihydroneopterin aldolase [Bacteroidetes bacterium MED-G17]|nr:MAG: Dihydroneopterin aldolase [Bacteroidetes bacterium MED-G17]|tara:strand:+ start:248 stop:628 length:381 start_codon:yes stop_codon:yes gene_type:complete